MALDKHESDLKPGLRRRSWGVAAVRALCYLAAAICLVHVYWQSYFGAVRHHAEVDGHNYGLKFDVSQLKNVDRDPLGEPLGYPTLNPNTTHLHVGHHAMVSSDVPICSRMGVSILQKGGNAADAAVTVALCIGSINLHSSGIGGGGYITSSQLGGEVISIDAREQAPRRAFKDMYKGKEILSKFGGLAVAVPGELKGLYELHSRHGSRNLTWMELFEPVIELNRNGFKVGKVLANALASSQKYLPLVWETGLLDSWDFLLKNHSAQEFVVENDFVKRPKLANTLELVGRCGSSDAFYDPKGPIVKSLVQEIRARGGWVTEQDFADYEVKVERALQFGFCPDGNITYTLYTAGGSSSGLALIAGLNFYAEVDKTFPTQDRALLVHRVIEGMKWMASARSNFGDFLFNSSQSDNSFRSGLIDKYSSAKWANETVYTKYSNHKTFPWKHYDPKYELTEPHGTSHFSIVDEQGNAVGMTTTVNLLFGSLVYDNRTGVFLNNEMDDFLVPNTSNAFNLTPSVYNFIHPKKRPLSSTSPTIIMEDGYPKLVIGAAGGSRISTAIFQAIVNIFYHRIPLLEAISYPRLHHQLIPESTMCESYKVFETLYHERDMISYLKENFGHDFIQTGPLTVMNGIKREKSVLDTDEHPYQWEGVSDYWRKMGEAWGY